MATRTTEGRFWGKVDQRGPDECWPWLGYVDPDSGYGQFWNGDRLVKAHRHAIREGREGIDVDHTCHNGSGCTDVPCSHRACVNPSHLEPVTRQVNAERGRGGDHQLAKTHCRNGHEYTVENTKVRISSNGKPSRLCRACRKTTVDSYNRKRA